MLAGIVLVGLLGSGCSGRTSSPGESVWDDPDRPCPAGAPDTLRVAVKFTVPLFGFRDLRTGAVEGFDADMAREVARRVRRKIVFLESGTRDREQLLQAGCADVVFSTYSVTPERRQKVDFSQVYWTARQVFLLGRNHRLPLSTSQVSGDVHEAVCTTGGSTSAARFRALLPEVELWEQELFSECFELLERHLNHPGEKHPERAGLARLSIVAVVGDDAILRGYLLDDPNRLKLSGVSGRPLSLEHYAAGLPKGSPLLGAVDRAILGMKQDGTWLRLCRRWIAPVTGSCPDPPPATPQVPEP